MDKVNTNAKTPYTYRKGIKMAKKVIDKFTDLAGVNTDPRTRRYLVPKRVVLTQGNVTGAEHLLDEKSNQITLVVGKDNCTLKNEPGKPHAAILLDFGIEFAGSARFHTWMANGSGHNGAAKVAIRFGESVMEALTPLGEKPDLSPSTLSFTAPQSDITSPSYPQSSRRTPLRSSGFSEAYLPFTLL